MKMSDVKRRGFETAADSGVKDAFIMPIVLWKEQTMVPMTNRRCDKRGHRGHRVIGKYLLHSEPRVTKTRLSRHTGDRESHRKTLETSAEGELSGN